MSVYPPNRDHEAEGRQGRRVQELEEQLARMTAERDQWRDRAALEARRHLRHSVEYGQEISTYQKSLKRAKDAQARLHEPKEVMTSPDESTIAKAANCILLDAIYEDVSMTLEQAKEIAGRLLNGEPPRDFLEGVWRHNLRVEGLL